jgi:hypothetical protein
VGRRGPRAAAPLRPLRLGWGLGLGAVSPANSQPAPGVRCSLGWSGQVLVKTSNPAATFQSSLASLCGYNLFGDVCVCSAPLLCSLLVLLAASAIPFPAAAIAGCRCGHLTLGWGPQAGQRKPERHVCCSAALPSGYANGSNQLLSACSLAAWPGP